MKLTFWSNLKHFSLASSVAVYLLVVHPLSPSGRLLLTSPPDKRSNIRSQSALADRCSGRAGSGRSSPAIGTPQWLFSDGASWHPNTPPPSPAHTEDGAEKKIKLLNLLHCGAVVGTVLILWHRSGISSTLIHSLKCSVCLQGCDPNNSASDKIEVHLQRWLVNKLNPNAQTVVINSGVNIHD